MFKIGDFSKITQVSIKALRYYDEIGLLKPVEVDRFTGYRFYSASQLPRLNRILALKDLGFTLEQIARLVDENVSPAEIRGMFKLKQAEIQQQVASEHARLARIEMRLRQIEQEDTMPEYEVVIKKVEPVQVVLLRRKIPTPEQVSEYVGPAFNEVMDYVTRQGGKFAGPAIAIWYDWSYPEGNIEFGAAWPVSEKLPSTDQIKLEQLPAETMACTIHRGSFDLFQQAYKELFGWVEANGYSINGANREVYLQYDPNADPSTYVTELQLPVTKQG